MWIFTNDAFISVVAHRTKPGVMLVRARIEGDITKLFPEATEIETPHADYRFRAEVSAFRFADAVMEEISCIDYDNFKGSIDKGDHSRHGAYMQVWSAMNQYQQRSTLQAGDDDTIDLFDNDDAYPRYM